MKGTTMELTADQRAALDALTAKRRLFVLAYAELGNATEAARRAGYAKPREEGARLLTFAAVKRGIEALRAPAESAQIATIDECRAFWTAIKRGAVNDSIVTREGEVLSVPPSLAVRSRAAELLTKSLGGFLERREITTTAAPEIRIVPPRTPEERAAMVARVKGSASAGKVVPRVVEMLEADVVALANGTPIDALPAGADDESEEW